MLTFIVKIDPEALQDIQQATDWYNEQLPGLGDRFQKQVKQQINSLRMNAQNYSIRYKNVRCMIIKKIPFLVHFTIEKLTTTVNVFAVIHTSRNPTIWKEK